MITLENKVVLVSYNTLYPENATKKWRVIICGIEKIEGKEEEKIVDGEIMFVDHVESYCHAISWSGRNMMNQLKHFMLFKAPQFHLAENQGMSVAFIGRLEQEEPTPQNGEVKPINPETELDAE